MRAAVVGLGLMGGSLARDLVARGDAVWGWDQDAEALERALEEGVLERALPADLSGLEDADLLVIALPVTAALQALETAARRLPPGSAATDLGSTKRSIDAAALRLGIGDRFVGSHPLTGDDRSGWSASRTGLFADATVYLCPTRETTPPALDRVRQMWTALGGRTQLVPAEDHDRALAWTSHLPQLTSSALALALGRAGFERERLGPGGRDVTRLAGSSPEMWAAICIDNADLIDPALAGLADRLAEIRSAVRAGDAAALHRLFAGARDWAR